MHRPANRASDASPRALANAVLRLAQRTPDALRAMGDAGRAWVGREHGRPVLAQRLNAALRTLVAPHTPNGSRPA